MKEQDGVIKEVTAVKVEVTTDPAAATNGDAPTNGVNGVLAVPIQTEDTKPTIHDNDDVDDDDADMKIPDEDLEEKLFEKLEHDQQEQELTHPHEQPKDVKAAPKLLQSAFQKGEVVPEDSESDSEKKSAAAEAAVASADHHTHARVRKKQKVWRGLELSIIHWSIICILPSKNMTTHEGSACCSHYRFFLPCYRPTNSTFYSPKHPSIPTLFPKTWKTFKPPWPRRPRKRWNVPKNGATKNARVMRNQPTTRKSRKRIVGKNSSRLLSRMQQCGRKVKPFLYSRLIWQTIVF
jgi:hypothetical protein